MCKSYFKRLVNYFFFINCTQSPVVVFFMFSVGFVSCHDESPHAVKSSDRSRILPEMASLFSHNTARRTVSLVQRFGSLPQGIFEIWDFRDWEDHTSLALLLLLLLPVN